MKTSPTDKNHLYYIVDSDGKEESGEMHRSECHATNLLAGLHQQQMSCKYTDFVIKTEARRFLCHKAVLASASPYFDNMFSTGLDESKVGEVTLNEIDEQTMEEIINYIYTGTLEVSLDTIDAVYAVADYLCMEDLKLFCIGFIKRKARASDYVKLRRLAVKYDLDAIVEKTAQLLHMSFQEVVDSEDFLTMTLQELQTCLRDDLLQVPNENKVVHAACTWISHQRECHIQHFDTIFQDLRLEFCSKPYLEELVKDELFQKPEYKMRVLACLSGIAQTVSSPRCNFSTKILRPIVIGGRIENNRVHDECFYYIKERNAWKSLTKLPLGMEFYSICATPTGFVVTGGQTANVMASERRAKQTCTCFDIDKWKWLPLPSMPKPRVKHGSAYMDDKIFVFGGMLGGGLIEWLVLGLNLTNHQWYSPARLLYGVENPMSVNMGTKILILGGVTTDGVTTKCQLFNSIIESCNALQSMPFPVQDGRAVAVNDKAYVVSDSVCMEYCLELDTWTMLRPISPPPSALQMGSLAYYDGVLLWAGGYKVSSQHPMEEISQFSFKKKGWSKGAFVLPKPLSFHHMLVLPMPMPFQH